MIAQLDPLYIRTRPTKALSRLISHLLFQGRFVTTDHRWLNTFILAELEALAQLPQVTEVEKPIFIIGTGRSGSTILGKVLSMHRDVGLLNEPKALWYIADPRDDVHGHFHKGPAQYRFTEADLTPAKRRTARRLFSAYSFVTRSRRVVDKNPEVVFRLPFVRAIFPDARFVFLVRNGWDTVRSITGWSHRHVRRVDGRLEDWWGADRRKWQLMVEQLVPTEPLLAASRDVIRTLQRQEDMAAVEWVIAMQEGLRHLREMPQWVYKLHYEELASDPRRTLEELRGFCELSSDEVFLSYAEQVLVPNPPKEPVVLVPEITPAFQATLAALGYPVGA